MYCKKCGRMLKNTEKFCSNCGCPVGNTHPGTRKHGKRWKIILIGILSVLLIISFLCIALRKNIIFLVEIKRIETELNKGNVEILSTGQSSDHENSRDVIENTVPALSEVLFRDMNVKTKIHWKTHSVTYSFYMPDMEECLENLVASEDKVLSEDEFMEDMEQYISYSEKKWFSGDVFYEWTDGRWVGNYQSEEFLNSLTGGIVKGYQKIYRQILEELSE